MTACKLQMALPVTLTDHLRFSHPHICCRHVRYEAGVFMKRHCHDEACLVLTLSGSITHMERSRETVLPAKSLLYLPAGETHADVFGPVGACCFISSIDPAWISNRLEGTHIDGEVPRVAEGGDLYALGLKLYEEFKRPDSLSELIVEGSFLELLGRWYRKHSHRPHGAPVWLKRVKTFLGDSFRESISLSDLSYVAGVHPAHVAREFHRVYGLTVGNYIRKMRVDFVAERLSTSYKEPPALAQLALEAGFSSHAHMSWTFKRLMGMTPSHYKRVHRITSL
jgi:AraC family transcriptional regulator